MSTLKWLQADAVKRTRLTTRISLAFTGVSLCFGIFEFFSGYRSFALSTVIESLSYFSCYLLNRWGFSQTARWGLLALVNLNFFLLSMKLGEPSQIHIAFFCMIGLPFGLFSLNEKLKYVIGGAVPIFLIAVLKMNNFAPLFSFITRSTEYPTWYPSANWYVAMSIIFYILYYYCKETYLVESSFHEQQEFLYSASKLSAIGEMAGGIAHEINNPLAILGLLSNQIKNTAQKLMASNPKDAITLISLADKSTETVERISKITTSLYGFTYGKKSGVKESIKLREIFENVSDLCIERFKSHNIKLSIVHPSPDLEIICNSVEVMHALVILMNNAFDACQNQPNPEVILSVQMDKASSRVLIFVDNSGSTVSEDNKEKLFQPFFTTKPAGSGLGLGLVIAKKIAQAHSGDLWYENKDPLTRFVMSIPLGQQV